MITLPLNPPVTVQLTPTTTAQADGVEILGITDNGSDVVGAAVNLNLVGGGKKRKLLTLWKDSEYIAIGDWTQIQAQNRIIELLEQ
jgi:hypothetical protein